MSRMELGCKICSQVANHKHKWSKTITVFSCDKHQEEIKIEAIKRRKTNG